MKLAQLTSDAPPPTARQERGAMMFALIAAAIILSIATPCCCFFGAGLLQGVSILRTGEDNNPARVRGKDKKVPNLYYPQQRREVWERARRERAGLLDAPDAAPDAPGDTSPGAP